MATVILDIPTEKIQSFMHMVVQLGIEKNAIRSAIGNPFIGDTLPLTKNFSKPIFKAYLLFDWEFYNNELEYE